MSIAETKTDFTAEDLLAMPNRNFFELVNGQLVALNGSNLSAWVGSTILSRLGLFVEEDDLGEVLNSTACYQCFPNQAGHVRKPKVSFIRKERLPSNWLAEQYFRIAPDLAVEVISQNDGSYELEAKILEYLDAGVRLVWVVNPEQRVIYVHRLDGTINRLRETDTLEGEDVLPGFSCRVSDLFPPATTKKQPTSR